MSRYINDFKNLQNKADIAIRTVISLAILNVLMMCLVVYAISTRKTVIELPPMPIEDTLVYSSSEVSESAFDMWSRFFIAYAANYAPENIEDNHHVLLKRAHPEYYAPISSNLSELEEHVKKNRIRQFFHPNWKKTSIEIRKNFALVIIEGKATREIGSKRNELTMIYKMKLAAEDGRMYLIELSKEEK